MKQKYKIKIAYDGTAYSGWQIQPNAVSIQGILEETLLKLTGESMRIIGSSRTDAGVHALAQTAHFTPAGLVEPTRLLKGLNALLPEDIRILSLEPVPEAFHAQYSAESKLYRYHLWLDRIHDPFLYPYRHRPKCRIDLDRLKEAIPYFVGTRDFTTFANVGTDFASGVRTIFRLECLPQKGGVCLEFEGNGFLYKMVRNITGTLLEVGAGKLSPKQIPDLFEAKDRKVAPMSAPARALFLVKINYKDSNELK